LTSQHIVKALEVEVVGDVLHVLKILIVQPQENLGLSSLTKSPQKGSLILILPTLLLLAESEGCTTIVNEF